MQCDESRCMAIYDSSFFLHNSKISMERPNINQYKENERTLKKRKQIKEGKLKKNKEQAVSFFIIK